MVYSYSSDDCSKVNLDEVPQAILESGDRFRSYTDRPEKGVCDLSPLYRIYFFLASEKKKNCKIKHTNLFTECAHICRILLRKLW